MAPKPTNFVEASDTNLAVLSPAFNIDIRRAAWIDLYDDWSIASDLHPARRFAARRTYERIYQHLRRETGAPKPLITVNSKYMAWKLGLNHRFVVPNGIDPSLSERRLCGDSKLRVVALGNFFAGRTDFNLLEEFSAFPWIEEFVIGGPGKDPRMWKTISRMGDHLGSRLVVKEWISNDELSKLAGQNTVALVPHKVSDYTLSQDLMKVYQFLALGIRVVCPMLLWPQCVSREYGFLIGPGIDLSDRVEAWISSAPPPQEWRNNFCAENSWSARAREIKSLLSEAWSNR